MDTRLAESNRLDSPLQDVIDRLPHPGAELSYLRQTVQDTRVEHRQDMAELRDLKCGASS